MGGGAPNRKIPEQNLIYANKNNMNQMNNVRSTGRLFVILKLRKMG